MRVTPFLDLGAHPHCNTFERKESLHTPLPRAPLVMARCADCHLVQLETTFSKDVMFGEHPYVSGTTRTLVEHFRTQAQRLIKELGLTRDDLVVDIGSNDGTFLKGYEGRVRVLGVEAAKNIAKIANDAGIATLNDFFTSRTARDIRARYGPASVISAAGVFFHLEELHDVTEGIRALLADDGTFFIQAMYLLDVVEKNAFDAFYHEHLMLYHLHPLATLLERHGLQVYHVERHPIHAGSILVRACHAGRRPADETVAAVLREEVDRGLNDATTYRRFAESAAAIRSQLRDMLGSLRAEGRRVALYGAGARGNTVLNYCGITPELVEYAVEKNPLKVGLYTPGTRIPIVSEARARENPPDCYLVLAWNFLDEFLAKETDFRARGGKFIVPFPQPHVV